MANFFITNFQTLQAALVQANASAANDSLYFQNDIELTAAQVLDLQAPENSGTLRFRGGNPANFDGAGNPTPGSLANPINYTLTVVNDLAISDVTPALASGANPPSFTIGPFTLRIGNGGEAGGLSGNLRGDDDGVLAFNRSADTSYSGTYFLEEENGLRNDVAGTTVTFTGASSIAAHVGGTGNPSDWDLEIDGDGDGVVQGVISDSYTDVNGLLREGVGNVVKEGEGTWTFAGANTYQGDTTVAEGTLLVDGSIENSLTTVGEEGTLGGNGTVGLVIVQGEGRIAAGNAGTGTLSTGSLVMVAGAELELEIGGTEAGSFDSLDVSGSVTLGGASLDLSLVDAFATEIGQSFTILSNDGEDAVSGRFADEDGNALAEGAIVEIDGRSFAISYAGGDGNDVVLTVVNTPPEANDDEAGVRQRAEVEGNVITDGEPDADSDGGTLAVTQIAYGAAAALAVDADGTEIAGRYGTLTLSADGSYEYDAGGTGGIAVGASATDTFTYTLSDGQGGTDTALLNVEVTGSASGDAGANVLLLTGPGTTARGLGGNDTYFVDSISDKVIEAANAGIDVVKSSASYVLGAQSIEQLILTGSGNTNATGNALDNTITGNAGANKLAGGFGRDILTGNAGADLFVFTKLSDSKASALDRDTITDFKLSQNDRIDLHQIDANTGSGGNQAFSFIGDDAFGNRAGELRAEYTAGGNTLISADVNGNGSADFSILLYGKVSLDSGDFIL